MFSVLAASQAPIKLPPSGFSPACDFVAWVEWDKLVIKTIPQTLRAVYRAAAKFQREALGETRELRRQDEAMRMERLEDLCTLAAECSRKLPNHLQRL